jgi:hypothetical protein
MRKTVLLLAFVMVVSHAGAESIAVPEELDLNRSEVDLDRVKEVYNSNSGEIPSLVANLVGGQKVNLYLQGENYSRSLKMDMDGVRLKSIEKGSWKSPSLEVWLETGTLNQLLASEQPMESLREKLESGEIEYREHGFMNSLKFFFLELFL